MSQVIVATDDVRIATRVPRFRRRGAADAGRPPDRHRPARRSRRALDCDIVVNVQGDEPLIEPARSTKRSRRCGRPGVQMTTLFRRITIPPSSTTRTSSRSSSIAAASRCIFRARRFRYIRDPRGGWPPLYQTYRPLRVSAQCAAGAGRRSSRRRSSGPSRSSSCARSSTASASRRSKPHTTRSAWTRRKTWNGCAACWRRRRVGR